MKETFDSVLSSVKDRFTNPFLGTFLFVWIVRNWFLVYGLFIFDKSNDMNYKLNYIKEYFKDYCIIKEFLINTGLSLLLLVIIYILLLGSQAIVQLYNLALNKIRACSDKIPIESKEHYNMLLSDLKRSRESYKKLASENDSNIAENERYKSDQIVLTTKNLKLERNLIWLFKENTKNMIFVNLYNSKIYHHFLYSDNTYHKIKDVIDEKSIIKALTEVFYDVSDNNNNLIIIIEKVFLEHILNLDIMPSDNYVKEDLTKRFEQVKSIYKDENIGMEQEKNIINILNKVGVVSSQVREHFTPIGMKVCQELFNI
ncbi:hypothetical protein ACPDHJ_05955 [Myroides sp. C8-3]|uniref:hypothetical protein n=1 Tax=Myroides sp. C8-3 TaxID=3400533 RepID=UPI003D2F5886